MAGHCCDPDGRQGHDRRYRRVLWAVLALLVKRRAGKSGRALGRPWRFPNWLGLAGREHCRHYGRLGLAGFPCGDPAGHDRVEEGDL